MQRVLTISCAEHDDQVAQDPLETDIVFAAQESAQCIEHQRAIEHDQKVAAGQLGQCHPGSLRQDADRLQRGLNLGCRDKRRWDELMVVLLREADGIYCSCEHGDWLKNAKEEVPVVWKRVLS